MMGTSTTVDLPDLEKLTLGKLVDILRPRTSTNGDSTATRPAAGPAPTPTDPSRPQPKCRNYLRFAKPQGVGAPSGRPFKVADLCEAYDFPTGLPGGGVIGILELGGGYTQADLDLFSTLNDLPQIKPIPISVNGGQNSPGGDADAEVLLDIQVAAASYYYATGSLPTIKVFFAPNTFDAFTAVINQAVTEGCDVLSISWGADESAWIASGLQFTAQQIETAAEVAAKKGCVIFASAGDNSSGDMSLGSNVDMPSSCPHIIGCGGTTKLAFSEKVWGSGIPNGEGTGGGYSNIFLPTPTWQLGVPAIGNSRMVPDVAANADPSTGYLIVIDGAEIAIGGTSAVAPLYAGLFAAFGQKLGFVAPTLYENPEAFVDITEGSNGTFQAAPGPDPCTGLGVPDGAALAALFLNSGDLIKRSTRRLVGVKK